MVYITGDLHGHLDINKLSDNKLRKLGINIKKDDYLIILGDFGLPFLDVDIEDENSDYNYWIKWLSERPYTICFIDGNHENFNFWDNQPITDWMGGKVQIHPKAKNVIHLMRGEVYIIENKKYFTFGGAHSIDKERRIENISWWSKEDATFEDKQNASINLKKHNYKVDYILTHTPPSLLTKKLWEHYYIPDLTAELLDCFVNKIEYKYWFAGHLHIDEIFKEEKTILLYDLIESVDSIEKYFLTS